MSERDPFEQLGDLIDQPVAPDARFATDLKSQLMRGLTASGEHSRDEEQQPVDIPYRPTLITMPEQQPKRRFKPLILLEIAAVAALLIGIAAAIGSGMFSSDPDDPATIPAAALQDDSAATPTSLPPTLVPPSSAEETRDAPASGTMEPTVVPPAGLLWQLPLLEGDALDYGGMAVHNGVIYRLVAASTFVGVEAVDSATGGVLWKRNADWDGFGGISADDNGVYYFATSTSERGGRPDLCALYGYRRDALVHLYPWITAWPGGG
jgi:hypothetical protein